MEGLVRLKERGRKEEKMGRRVLKDDEKGETHVVSAWKSFTAAASVV